MPSDLNDDFASRIEQLFHECSKLEPALRAAFLDAACNGDEPLRTEVDQLLAAAARVHSTPGWDMPALRNEALLAAAPQQSTLERYKLLDRIGSGGMGTVYRAQRADDEFSKVVAIKILNGLPAGPARDHMLRRFLQERQILAKLEHPNIARLLDGGSTADQLPFIAMEYVEGIPIHRYVRERGLPVKEVLDLFGKICSAVSYAHRNLIIHRDLKPDNILVTAAGEPKLLDFGIAKLLDGSTGQTRTEWSALTPQYASPEQVRNEPITTASDTYSLGVLLHELLNGNRPYRHTSNSLDLARAICMDEPLPLPGIDRDLQNIVQMALRKEPERRYASVDLLAEDIRRYQDGYPVSARPDTRAYRARKFVGRNKTSVAAGIVVMLALLAGGTATWWEARVARERFYDVRKLANSYLFEFHDAIRDLPGSTPARQLVAKRALEYLDSLSRQSAGDASLMTELAAAYERVAMVQGAPNMPSLGDLRGAVETTRKALAIRERITAREPHGVDAAMNLAKCAMLFGEFQLHLGDLKTAAEMYRKAVSTMEPLATRNPGDSEVRSNLADAYMALGDVTGNSDVENLGDAKGAIEWFKKSLEIRLRVVHDRPDKREDRQTLGAVYGRLATVSSALNDTAGAEAYLRKAIQVDEELVRQDPFNVRYKREVAVYSRSLSLLYLRIGNVDPARAAGDRSADLFAELAKADPMNASAEEAVADSIWSQGFVWEKSKNLDRARPLYEASIEAYRRLLAKHPGARPSGMRTAYQLLAGINLKQKRPADAIRAAEQELAIDDDLLKHDARNASARRNQAVASAQIAGAHEIQKDWKAACRWYERSISIWEKVRTDGMLIPAYVKVAAEPRAGLERCKKAGQE